MAGELKNIAKVACIYATTIIGAGFASGQEIMQFFTIYKKGGFYGIILAGALFSLIGCIVLKKVYGERIKNYEEFLFPTFGWFAGCLMEAAVTLFMLFLFCIMLAGSGNVISDRLGIPFGTAALFMGFVSMVLIFTNVKGIVALSTFITPVMIAGIILAGLCAILFSESDAAGIMQFLPHITNNWVISSILYVSYNSIPAIVMMCSLQPYLKTPGTAVAGGILGGALLCIAALVANAAIFMFYPAVYEKELPMLDILKSFSEPSGNLYAVILWLAMLTSAVTSGYCLSERMGNILGVGRKIVTLILCFSAAPLSTLGFSKLISVIYPLFGYLGLFMIIVIIADGIITLRKAASDSYGRK